MTAVRLDPKRSALILIDLMTRTVALDTAPITAAEVVQRCAEVTAAARRAGWLVVHVRAERPGVAEQPPGGELVDACTRQGADVEIVKRTWGAFHGTDLDEVLRGRGIRTVVLGGIATNFGVESTGRAANERGFHVVFLSDAMAGLHGYAHDFAVDYVFPRLGVVCTAAELLDGLR
ncbi:isochorismatase family protein [Micromonospora sp. WMMA1998]|uniref:isochorismatase family protein n=1 Tax=unclassified Micromonospora TaxID=2617518 RepID=UPI00248D06F0|nr:isochorismatase family protein [Micromonospora sp. WMMA1998]WBC16739.1 isochorismatase family protein [Micromonospora sp. WMMA1998]